MRSEFLLAVSLSLTLLSGVALARSDVPLVNHPNIAITSGSGKPLSQEQVKQAIMAGAAAKTWTTTLEQDGSITATVLVRNKHSASVRIVFSSEKYSVTYKDSINLKFIDKGSDGQFIHPHYNGWVNNLIDAIRIETGRL